jgi:hypothetical protein
MKLVTTLAFLTLGFVETSLLAQTEILGREYLPDAKLGQIDGKSAVHVLPIVRGTPIEILNPAGFEAHFVRFDDLDKEIVLPAGQWVLPETGHSYRVWLEGEWLMSPEPANIIVGDGLFKQRGNVVFVPITGAGRVRPAPDVASRSDLEMRLLQGTDRIRDEISRRKPNTEAADGLLMPAGLTIGAFWDESQNRYVSLSRPFRVEAKQITELAWGSVYSRSSHLLVLAHRAAIAKKSDLEVQLTLFEGEKGRKPDFEIETACKIYAIWYDLKPGKAKISAKVGTFVALNGEVDLGPGRIERFEGSLATLPKLQP